MVPHRHEISDEEWGALQPLLPPSQTWGRYYRDHRRLLNGMLLQINAGIPWRDSPERYGPWQTAYSRYRRWSRCGLWDRILAALQRALDATSKIE